jgi:hypothetical protein
MAAAINQKRSALEDIGSTFTAKIGDRPRFASLTSRVPGRNLEIVVCPRLPIARLSRDAGEKGSVLDSDERW